MATVRTRTGGLTVDQTWLGDQIKRIANQMAGKSAFEIGLWVEGQAKSLAPVAEGRLAGSIQTVGQSGLKSSPKNAEDTIAAPTRLGEVYVGTALEYAPYVEFGTGIYSPDGRKTPWSYEDANGKWHTTRGMPAQPFLRPALAIAKGEALTIVEDNGKMAFKEYLK